MPVQQLPALRVNGAIPSWSSLQFNLDALRNARGVIAIDYKLTAESEDVFGAGRMSLGYTLGQVKHEGSLTMYLEDAMALRRGLGAGYMDKVFQITVVTRATPTSVLVTDVLKVKLKEVGKDYKPGMEALSEKLPLHLIRWRVDGRDAFDPIDGYNDI